MNKTWTKTAKYSALLGPVFLIATIGTSGIPGFLIIILLLSFISGCLALITGIIASKKEGNSSATLFAIIIGTIWVLFGLFALLI